MVAPLRYKTLRGPALIFFFSLSTITMDDPMGKPHPTMLTALPQLPPPLLLHLASCQVIHCQWWLLAWLGCPSHWLHKGRRSSPGSKTAWSMWSHMDPDAHSASGSTSSSCYCTQMKCFNKCLKTHRSAPSVSLVWSLSIRLGLTQLNGKVMMTILR